jgi:hypothetical protein
MRCGRRCISEVCGIFNGTKATCLSTSSLPGLRPWCDSEESLELPCEEAIIHSLRWPPGLTSLLQNRCRRLRRPSILSSIVDACLEATWDLPLTETRWFASLSPHHQELACYVEIMFLCAVLLGNPRTCRLIFCLPSTRPFQLEWSPEASQIDVKLASVVSLPLHKNFT